MPAPKKRRNTGCPIAFALDTFGDRWSLLIIRDLLLKGSETYGEFLEGDEGFATNILADRLKDLEAEGIIRKSRDPQNKRRNIYRLTEKGTDLAPTILEIIRWSERYDSNTFVKKRMIERITNERDALLAELRARALRP